MVSSWVGDEVGKSPAALPCAAPACVAFQALASPSGWMRSTLRPAGRHLTITRGRQRGRGHPESLSGWGGSPRPGIESMCRGSRLAAGPCAGVTLTSAGSRPDSDLFARSTNQPPSLGSIPVARRLSSSEPHSKTTSDPSPTTHAHGWAVSAAMYCQKCRTPLRLDGSLEGLNPAAYDLLVGKHADTHTLPLPRAHPPSGTTRAHRLSPQQHTPNSHRRSHPPPGRCTCMSPRGKLHTIEPLEMPRHPYSSAMAPPAGERATHETTPCRLFS